MKYAMLAMLMLSSVVWGQEPKPAASTDPALPGHAVESREARIARLIDAIDRSGRVLNILETKQRIAGPRTQIAPGAPPLLSFRYFAGADRHRFGQLDVMMDDAGH